MKEVGLGRVLGAKLVECKNLTINAAGLKFLLKNAASVSGTEVLRTAYEDFFNDGATAVIILKESHFTIRTWPERETVVINLYTCGRSELIIAMRLIAKQLRARKVFGLIHNLETDETEKIYEKFITD